MPNYRRGAFDYVIDSSFQPFSMQEMLTPLALYKEAFEKSEEAYTDLKTKADVFKELSASLPEDSKARQIYEGYANDLNIQAEDLARNGLNMGNRRALTSLKQRYSGEIGELDRAKTKLDEVLKIRSALEASGKRRYYATNNPTIDDFLGGNTPNMYSIDPDVLYAKGAQRGKAISSRMYDTKEGGSAINGYFRNIMDIRGMNPQQLASFMQSKEFNDMVDLAMIEEGVAGNLKGTDYLRAKQNYISGMFDSVIYEEKNNWQRDPGVPSWVEKHNAAIADAQLKIAQEELGIKREELKIKQDAAKLAAKQAEAEAAGGSGVKISPINIYDQKEKDASNKYIRDYSRFFERGADGGVKMTKEGLAEYNRKYYSSTTYPIGHVQGAARDSGFKTFIDSIGGKELAKGRAIGRLGNLWDKYVKEHSDNVYDATKSTEFKYTPDDSHLKQFKRSVVTANEGNDFEEVKFDSKTNTFVPTGKTMSSKDFLNDKVSISDTRFSSYGNTMMVIDKDGTPRRYRMPKGIDTVNEYNRDVNLAKAMEIQKAIVSKKYTDTNGEEHTLNQEELALYNQLYKQYLQKAEMHQSQLFGTNKTKEQEFESYGE